MYINLHRLQNYIKIYHLRNCGYSEEELEHANPGDMNIYYSLEEQSRYGVVGIEVEIMSDVAEKVTKSLRNTSK